MGLGGQLSSMLNGLARSFASKKEGNKRSSCVEEMAKEAKKNELMLCSSGSVNVDGSNNFASVFSKKGQKGVNQDCCLVWEEYGCQEDMIFCGIFDGHGAWGHFVAKRVRDSMPRSLLCNWQQETAELVEKEKEKEINIDNKSRGLLLFNIWKKCYLKTCADIDEELKKYVKIDSFYSGTTALSIVRQGEVVMIANVGDSRAVLATTSEDNDGSLVAVQLTIDLKPNLAEEEERIIECQGRVFCLEDEPGVHRVWLPNGESPGLAMSRAFGDYCIKDYGLISVPQVTQLNITIRDHFLVLATDGVWDVISNQEAVQIVSSTLPADKSKSAKRLVDSAADAWKRKRRGIAMDDISAICLFFH